MTERYRTLQSEHLHEWWSFLNEYYDFCRMARHRRKLEKQLHDAHIPLTHVPWKSMVRALLCNNLFDDEHLKEMNINTLECCTADDVAASETIVNALVESDQEDKNNLTETWVEIEELKRYFQRAIDHIPINRRARKEMLYRILGYPTGYSDDETNYNFIQDQNGDDNKQLDLTHVLSNDEQFQMRTGDLIELSGNRLHDAFYIYRLPQKGIWTQIQQMWSKHQITDFVFNDTQACVEEEEEEEGIILVPAKDEYGYGVPYLFATRPTESLPDGALHKYVDINCSLIAKHRQNSTIALVLQHLNERLNNPVYQDKYMDVEMTVESDRFPQEYVAIVHINDAPTDNVIWTRLAHYNGKKIATDLNDNFDVFVSRRILEAEEQYRQTKSHKSKTLSN